MEIKNLFPLWRVLRPFLYVYVISIFIVLTSYAQITIAPTAIHLNNNHRSDRIIVYNSSNNKTQEIELAVSFGYPATDEKGSVAIYYPEEISENDPSAADWVYFYPRRFILQPGEKQTVRVAVRPPSNLSQGEYWARPVIKTRDVTGIVSGSEVENDSAVRVGLSTQVNTVIALNYRHGSVSTGVEITELTEKLDEENLSIRVGMTRKGNAAYLGNCIVRIRDSNNRIIEEQRREVAVYYDLTRIFTFARKDYRPGVYTVEVELNTDRQLAGGYILPVKSVRKSVRVNIL